MKMLLLLLTFCSLRTPVSIAEPDIATLRTLFYAAEKSKSAWIKFSETVRSVKHHHKPIYVCYNGVSEMMGAKYVVNPVSKLNRFKKGKVLIERAVNEAPEELEIRFLRFSIQTNLPSFLGYNEDIHKDKKMLLNRFSQVKDKSLKMNIIKYLSSSKYCTAEEKKILMK